MVKVGYRIVRELVRLDEPVVVIDEKRNSAHVARSARKATDDLRCLMRGARMRSNELRYIRLKSWLFPVESLRQIYGQLCHVGRPGARRVPVNAVLAFGPLTREGRLAVARRGDQQDRPRRGALEQLDQPRAFDDAAAACRGARGFACLPHGLR